MSEENENIQTVRRRQAKSGKVSYGDLVLIHETSKTRIAMVPFFIPHSDHTELAVKIISYQKAPPPMEWAVVDEKSVSLQEPAARKLFSALRSHLHIAREDEDGNYLLIRVSEGTAQIGEHDPAEVASALTKVLSQNEILTHLKDTELSYEFVNAFRGAIRLKEMRSAVAELRNYLENRESAECIYQAWCEKHSWAFGNAYVMKDDVREITPGDHLDLMLPNVIAGYRDIVELKRPDMPVLYYDDTHRNYYFSAEVSKAIGQCHRYLDILHEVAAQGLRDHPEIVAYHPRAIIVIGRSDDWEEEKMKCLHGLNQRLLSITIMTYDHLMAQGERLVDILSPREVPGDTQFDDQVEWDDDVPF